MNSDFLIIGSGIAGLSAAHFLKDKGSVTVMTKGKLREANTYWAQGGVAAVALPEDSFESHIQDTLKAGSYLNDEKAVRILVEHAPRSIRFLKSIGVPFKDEPALEAAHSHARVWRTSDFTGQDILNHLIKQVKKEKNITILEDAEAVELIEEEGRCVGTWARHEKQTKPFLATHTILATGGLGQLYAKTSNPLGAGGDGLALALKARLSLKDLEFIQFHPTAVDRLDEGRYFLLSETLRGFGAKIVNQSGQAFMKNYHPDADLAPRDLVTRAVYFELQKGPVYLSLQHLDPTEVKNHFPNIAKRLKEYNLNLAEDLIPITPVAHFASGGIPVDLNAKTELPGLYAVGEVACTGVHGANRLASNALLEGMVFAERMANNINVDEGANNHSRLQKTPFENPPTLITEPIAEVKAYAKRLGQVMWEHAGIVRDPSHYQKAKLQIESIPSRDYRIHNRKRVAQAILDSCANRPESVGGHYVI